MNYSNHSLRTDLQEWKNRLYRATDSQFGQQIKYFLNNLSSNKQLSGILKEASINHPYDSETLDEIVDHLMEGSEMSFESERHQASFCFQFISHFVQTYKTYSLHHSTIFMRSTPEETMNMVIESLFSPVIYYLHDQLNKSSSIIYLLEKYKMRTELFTRRDLCEQYKNAQDNYEKIFEDDLRLFLFDQGIDYPFSTPLSASGRADIIGNIDTEDPLIVEIKIFDRKKNYGKGRIKGGFSQTVRYTDNYNKDVGYLVIFNMEKAEINLKFSESDNVFPPSIYFNNKIFYFVIINVADIDSASNIGITKEIEITESELTKSI